MLALREVLTCKVYTRVYHRVIGFWNDNLPGGGVITVFTQGTEEIKWGKGYGIQS